MKKLHVSTARVAAAFSISLCGAEKPTIAVPLKCIQGKSYRATRQVGAIDSLLHFFVDQKKVSISDPVSKYFPQIPDKVVTAVKDDGSYEGLPGIR
jgi:hypothetical protein